MKRKGIKWDDLSPETKYKILDDIEKANKLIMEGTRVQSSILSNWLYGLTTAGFGAIISVVTSSKISGKLFLTSSHWFLAALIFCVLAVVLEWCRYWNASRRLNPKANELVANDTTDIEFYSSQKEHCGWLSSVLLLRAMGYGSLLCGIYSLTSLLLN